MKQLLCEAHSKALNIYFRMKHRQTYKPFWHSIPILKSVSSLGFLGMWGQRTLEVVLFFLPLGMDSSISILRRMSN
jgi:hypothetical protein